MLDSAARENKLPNLSAYRIIIEGKAMRYEATHTGV